MCPPTASASPPPTTDYFSLFAQHVRGLRRFGDEVRGHCPFHEDNKPSFTASGVSGLWRCFGCDAKGTARQFAERITTAQGVLEEWTKTAPKVIAVLADAAVGLKGAIKTLEKK